MRYRRRWARRNGYWRTMATRRAARCRNCKGAVWRYWWRPGRTILGNIKRSLHGTYHHLSSKHLPRYLAEFSYRFNRRFSLSEMFPRLAFVALRTPPMPYRVLKLAENYP